MARSALLAVGALVSTCSGHPVVQMHGMGDFAQNPMGMKPLARAISEALGGEHVVNVQVSGAMLSCLGRWSLALPDVVGRG